MYNPSHSKVIRTVASPQRRPISIALDRRQCGKPTGNGDSQGLNTTKGARSVPVRSEVRNGIRVAISRTSRPMQAAGQTEGSAAGSGGLHRKVTRGTGGIDQAGASVQASVGTRGTGHSPPPCHVVSRGQPVEYSALAGPIVRMRSRCRSSSRESRRVSPARSPGRSRGGQRSGRCRRGSLAVLPSPSRGVD